MQVVVVRVEIFWLSGGSEGGVSARFSRITSSTYPVFRGLPIVIKGTLDNSYLLCL
jgi:hypothetical protein